MKGKITSKLTVQNRKGKTICQQRPNVRHLIFYNNCLISRPPIGSFLPSVGVQTNKILIYTSFQVSSVFSCQIFNFLTSGVLLTFIRSQSKNEKSYKLATLKLFSSSLISFTASLRRLFSSFIPDIWIFWGPVIIVKTNWPQFFIRPPSYWW